MAGFPGKRKSTLVKYIVAFITLLIVATLFLCLYFVWLKKGLDNRKAENASTDSKDLVVVIDAGHGGSEPGCVIGNIMEKDITLSIAHKVEKKLNSQNITVIMTRNLDEYPTLKERGEMAQGADYFVSIHCNSNTYNTSAFGFECYYYYDRDKKLAEQLIQEARTKGIVENGMKYGDFQVLRDTDMPSVLVETGYMTNERELENLCSKEYQLELADVIADAIGSMEENQ
ncbi:MAG: N-acetylmuramoyl-L-alanine amidase [Lachnospiraceae bacterium]|nr:N-acetylmuramoyl-L-alanine amidase [Lachnospiraceae bacterium]